MSRKNVVLVCPIGPTNLVSEFSEKGLSKIKKVIDFELSGCIIQPSFDSSVYSYTVYSSSGFKIAHISLCEVLL